MCAIFVYFVIFNYAKAEISLAEIKTNIIVSPENPSSYKYVSVTLSSSVVDLSRAEITWSLDNNIALKGVGEKTLRFKTGAVGTSNKIGAVIKTYDGNLIYKDIEVRPSDVDLIWEANTYTPPFYKGKALDTQGSLIKIVAIQQMIDKNNIKIPSKNLMYKWIVKDEVNAESSGYGKNVYTFQSEIIDVRETVGLNIKSIDQTLSAEKELTLIGTDTKPVIYKNDPLLGILFNNGLNKKTSRLDNAEIGLSIYPFFFSTKKRESNIKYSWKINGAVVGNDNSIVFTKPKDPGISEISTTAEGINNVFQKGDADFFIDFSGQ